MPRPRARDLAAQLAPGNRAHAERVAKESGGNPLFIAEIVRHVGSLATSLDQAILARYRQLPPAAQRLLAVIAVAGQPIGQTLATDLAVPGTDDGPLSRLRAERWVEARAGDRSRPRTIG